MSTNGNFMPNTPSQNPNMTISGNGDGDGNDVEERSLVWEVKVFGFGDEDGDGVPDNIDKCEGKMNNQNYCPLNQDAYGIN